MCPSPPTPPDLRFRRCARLLSGRDFGQVFAAPQRYADRFFTVLARPNTVGCARLGLAISKKAARRATDRNRLKRLVRESFRHHRTALPAVDIVVMVRPAAVSEPNATLARSLAKVLEKLNGQGLR
ncbi:MAG: ribonuclease P protein component [Gammaproteobacteria bacterium]|nr:ribonuclease P protein component [Gammaproteobacteria bacterium]